MFGKSGARTETDTEQQIISYSGVTENQLTDMAICDHEM